MENKEQMTMGEILPDEEVLKEETLTPTGYIYRFEEMKDAMEASINNLDKVKEQQAKLLKIVESDKDAEYFKDFIEESKKQQENFEKQRNELEVKIALLVTLLDKCKANEEVSQAVYTLCEILGLFKN